MRTFWMVQKDILLLLRNKKTFLLLLLMPLILIAILGSALSNVFSEEEVDSIAQFQIGVIDEDRSEQSETFIQEALQVPLKSYVSVVELTRKELNDAIKQQEIRTALIIPAGFGDSRQQQQAPNLTIVAIDANSIETNLIKSAVMQYDETSIRMNAAIEVITSYSGGSAINLISSVAPESFIEQQSATQQEELDEATMPFVEVTATGTTKSVSSFQYYAVAMGVMYLLLTVITLVGAMLEEKNDTVYARQLTTRMVAWQYTLSKFIGMLLISLLQLTIIIGVTSFVYGVDWGDSIGAIMITMISFTVSTSGLAVFIASLMRREQSFHSVGMLGTQIMSALGGSFVPIYMFPDWIAMLGKLLPNSLALQMFLSIMTGGNVASIMNEAMIATIVGLLLLSVAWWRMASKGGEAVHA